MIDWKLAARVADVVAGEQSAAPLTFDPVVYAQRSEALVREYTHLRPLRPIPIPEVVDRAAWARANLASMSRLLEGPTAKFGQGLGPFKGPLRAAAGGLLGVEVGAVVGYIAKRVMGQYDLVLVDPDIPPRLLLVAPNMQIVQMQLQARSEDLWLWVTLHEVTHALQFGGVPWLREYLAGLITELFATAEIKVDPARVARLPSRDDFTELLKLVREDGLIAAVTTPRQRELIDQVQAVMALLEGHAEHVMDAVGTDYLPELPRLRAGLERRRQLQPPIFRLINRLLGFDLKLAQYEIGKRFCDAVVREGGIEALNTAWSSAAAVPTLAELERPDLWLVRVR